MNQTKTNENLNFKVEQENFEGPLSLLMHLIEKRKLAITDISLSKITDEYIEYLKQNYSSIPSNSAFISTASTLLLIKSHSLLPTLELTTKEESDIEELQKRLSYYQIIKNTSQLIKDKTQYKSFYRSNFQKNQTIVFCPHESINKQNVQKSIENILNRLPDKKEIKKAELKKVVSLDEMINSIMKRVRNEISFDFSDINKDSDKHGVVVSFLALLELAKDKKISTKQDKTCGKIEVEMSTPQTLNLN